MNGFIYTSENIRDMPVGSMEDVLVGEGKIMPHERFDFQILCYCICGFWSGIPKCIFFRYCVYINGVLPLMEISGWSLDLGRVSSGVTAIYIAIDASILVNHLKSGSS